MRRSLLRRATAIALAAALAAGLAACTSDPLAEQYRAGDNKGFVAGAFTTKEFAPADRSKPVDFTGRTDAGTGVTSTQYRGSVLVVNFWYAGCGPCRLEAPRLEKAYQEFAGQDVAFLGVNIYDQAPQSLAFAKQYGVTYPSVIAVNDGTVKLAFAAVVPLTAVPVTLVLDRTGRVMARIVGTLPDASILTAFVRDGLAEKA